MTMVAQSFANPNGFPQGMAARPPLAIVGAEAVGMVQGSGGGEIQGTAEAEAAGRRFAGPGAGDDREAAGEAGVSVAGRLGEPVCEVYSFAMHRNLRLVANMTLAQRKAYIRRVGREALKKSREGLR